MRSNTAANLGWRSLGPTEIAKQLQQGDFYLENLMVSRKVKWRTRWSCLRESRGELEGITSTIAGSKMQKPPSQSHQNTPEQSSLTERRRNETQRWMRREAPPAGERNPHTPTNTMDDGPHCTGGTTTTRHTQKVTRQSQSYAEKAI